MMRKAVIVVLTFLAVATGALWGASYVWYEQPERLLAGSDIPLRPQMHSSEWSMWTFTLGRNVLGWVKLSRGRVRVHVLRKLERAYSSYSRSDGEVCGLRFTRETLPTTGAWQHHYSLIVPLWIPPLVLAPYPLTVFLCGTLRRARRRRRGLCPACGYDLTGNVSGACSECGTEIKQP